MTDVVRNGGFALPMEDIRILPLRDSLGIRERCPKEMFQVRQVSSNVCNGLSLSELDVERHGRPEIGHSVDHVSVLERPAQAGRVIQIGRKDFDTFCRQVFAFLGVDITGQATNSVFVGLLEQCLDDRATL